MCYETNALKQTPAGCYGGEHPVAQAGLVLPELVDHHHVGSPTSWLAGFLQSSCLCLPRTSTAVRNSLAVRNGYSFQDAVVRLQKVVPRPDMDMHRRPQAGCTQPEARSSQKFNLRSIGMLYRVTLLRESCHMAVEAKATEGYLLGPCKSLRCTVGVCSCMRSAPS